MPDVSYCRDALIERARILVPELRKRALETSRARTLPKQTIDDFWNANLWHLLKPKKFGGPEVRLNDALAVAGELGRGDGSAAWIWTVLGVHDLLICYFPERAQKECWAKNRTLAASSFAPTGVAEPADGGFHVSGRWSFCSGIDYADWMILAVRAGLRSNEPSVPDIRFVLVERSDFRVIDDWYVMGLQGTGSKTCVVENAFVPAHRTVRVEDCRSGGTPGAMVHAANNLYRTPLWSVFPFCISSPAIGIARGAFDAFLESVRNRESRAEQSPVTKRPNIQLRVAEAGALIDAADLLYNRALNETIDLIMCGKPLSLDLRVRNRRDQGYAVKTAKHALELLLTAEGSAGLFEDHSIQRAFRDLQAITAHIVGGWDNAALCYGSVALGNPPTDLLW